MGWSEWFGGQGGEKSCEKTTTNDKGNTVKETLRTNDGSKENHQHSWVERTPDGKGVRGGSTPGKR